MAGVQDSDAGGAMQRPDGRSTGQLRQVSIETGVLSRADGSARFASGSTAVLASVVGPREVLGSRSGERMDRAVLDIVLKPERGQVSSVHKDREYTLRCTLESCVQLKLFPRKVISVTVQVISDDGSLLAVSFAAALAALMDGGVPMLSLPMLVGIAIRSDGTAVLDPVMSEEADAVARLTLGVAQAVPGQSEPRLCTAVTDGVVAQKKLAECVVRADKAAAVLRNVLSRAFTAETEALLQVAGVLDAMNSGDDGQTNEAPVAPRYGAENSMEDA